MCGLSGIIQRNVNEPLKQAFIKASQLYLRERGPDRFAYKEVLSGVTLVHSRLSIIDLQSGDQPMGSGRNAIVFNGEIYNYNDIKDPAIHYKTHSDTEVLLHGLERHGLKFLNQADGMFAFAWYDHANRTVNLARDAFGIKPLYYFFGGEHFAFASRLQPLMLLSKKIIDRQAMVEYYAGRAARAPRTIFSDVHELRAGEALSFDIERFSIVSQKRWALPFHAKRTEHDEVNALERLDAAMKLSIKRHLVSDVPVATFLSGGVDSSLITALAAKENPQLAAFSIGFTDKRFDESPYAAAVCKRYDIRHHVHYCDHLEFMSHIERWPEVMDDAVADPSAVMLSVLSHYARDMGYKVVLSGEGADELFGGYNQYRRFLLAKRFSGVGKYMPVLERFIARLKPGQSRYIQFARHATSDPYFYGTGRIFEPYLLPDLIDMEGIEFERADTLDGALQLDLERRLPDDILTRTDRATMDASIEARVPFMTRYVWEASATLGEELLIKGRQQKYLLKKLAERYVPHECLYRRKVGFDLPLAHWLRHELREYMLDNLHNSWQANYLNPGAMNGVIEAHLRAQNNNADKIWAFLLLENNVRALKAITVDSVNQRAG